MKPALARPALLAVLLAAGTAPAVADCMCVANGARFEQGQTACIRISSGSYLARCDKVLNNSSWKKISDGCPDVSGLYPKPGARPTAPAGASRDGRPG